MHCSRADCASLCVQTRVAAALCLETAASFLQPHVLACAVLCSFPHSAGRLWGWTGAGTADGDNCKFVDAAGKAVKQEDILAQIIHLAAAESTDLN